MKFAALTQLRYRVWKRLKLQDTDYTKKSGEISVEIRLIFMALLKHKIV